MGRVCSTHGDKGNKCRVLVGKSEGKRPLGRPRCRWDDIKIDLGERRCGVMDWINLAQDSDQWRALVYTVMNLMISYIVGELLSG
jgi:hypothetical protein